MRQRFSIGDRGLEVELELHSGALRARIGARQLEGTVLRHEPGFLVLQLGARVVRARIGSNSPGTWSVILDGADHLVRTAQASGAAAGGPLQGRLVSPIPGKVVRLEVGPGARVKRGQVVAILESMKMQTELRAPCDGMVERVWARLGALLQPGEEILSIQPDSAG
jgi:biotin carboxyl carrier protein